MTQQIVCRRGIGECAGRLDEMGLSGGVNKGVNSSAMGVAQRVSPQDVKPLSGRRREVLISPF